MYVTVLKKIIIPILVLLFINRTAFQQTKEQFPKQANKQKTKLLKSLCRIIFFYLVFTFELTGIKRNIIVKNTRIGKSPNKPTKEINKWDKEVGREN